MGLPVTAKIALTIAAARPMMEIGSIFLFFLF
jgi:hypothetical protein